MTPTIHSMQLHAGPFAQIRDGSKRSELRLNDEKRQLVRLGDLIEFISRSDPEQKLLTEVTSLQAYPTFKELFAKVSKDYPQWDEASFLQGMRSYYTPEQETAYGALEIGIRLIP
jgi:ASC-1-like (ASCH) protein